jgi:hypothetical protein
VGIDVKFGMPKYNCRYHGICRLDIDENDLYTPHSPICGRARGWLFVPRADFCLIFFDKASMTKTTRQTHFQAAYFEMGETAPVSDRLGEYLGQGMSLTAGRYRIMEKNDWYGVLFNAIIH